MTKELKPPTQLTRRDEWNDRNRRGGVRINTSPPDSVAGRIAWKDAIRKAGAIITYIALAADNYSNPDGLRAIEKAQKIHLEGEFCFTDYCTPDGVYHDHNRSLMNALMYAESIIQCAIEGTFEDESTLKPLDMTWSEYGRALVRMALKSAYDFQRNQYHSLSYFNAQAQTWVCNNCGKDKRIGWHEHRWGVDSVVCESMVTVDNNVQIDY